MKLLKQNLKKKGEKVIEKFQKVKKKDEIEKKKGNRKEEQKKCEKNGAQKNQGFAGKKLLKVTFTKNHHRRISSQCIIIKIRLARNRLN